MARVVDLGAMSFVNPHHGVPTPLMAVLPATRPVPWPRHPGAVDELEVTVAGAGRRWSLVEVHEATVSTTLVVVVEGRVVHEWYAAGLGPTDLLLGASASKSVLAHLVGQAVATGDLSLDASAGAVVPELATSGYAAVTVAELLTMTSGVDWVEDHRDSDGPASRLAGALFLGGDSRALLTQVRPLAAPGTRYEYSTADSQVLDWVRERATGVTFAEALGSLWARLGAESEVRVLVDGAGVAAAGGGIAATARDWARVAWLQVDGCAPDGDRILDPGWVSRSSTPAHDFLAPGRLPSSITTHAGFGMHWWPLDDAGLRVTADGSRGQLAYAERDRATVVVKTSRWPYADWLADRQSRDLTYLALPAIAAAARHTVGASAPHLPGKAAS